MAPAITKNSRLIDFNAVWLESFLLILIYLPINIKASQQQYTNSYG